MSSMYTKTLNHLRAVCAEGSRFTPQSYRHYLSTPRELSDYINAFKTLKANGVIREIDGVYMTELDIVYEYVGSHKPETPKISIQFDPNEFDRAIAEAAQKQKKRSLEDVPPKVIEQTAKGEILSKLASIVNDINQLYAKIEQLETPHDVDLTKVSKEDLLAEVMRRVS